MFLKLNKPRSHQFTSTISPTYGQFLFLIIPFNDMVPILNKRSNKIQIRLGKPFSSMSNKCFSFFLDLWSPFLSLYRYKDFSVRGISKYI